MNTTSLSATARKTTRAIGGSVSLLRLTGEYRVAVKMLLDEEVLIKYI
jgi:hypothetical protein